MEVEEYIFLISCLLLSYILYLCNPYAVIGGLLFTLYAFFIFKSEDKNKK